MATTEPDLHDVVARFLAALAGDDGGAAFIELRYRLYDGERMGQLFESTRRLRSLATRVIALGRRTDVYVGCAPRTRRAGGRNAVARSFALWADCDGEAASRALESFAPEPSIVIASGTCRNRHAYWLLEEPVERETLELANRWLADTLGADPACAEPARILRPPGTLSHKHSPPAQVELLRFEPQRRVALRDIVGDIADAAAAARPARGEVTRPGRLRDPLLAITPDVYISRLLGVEIPHHRKVPCPFHADERASLHVYETPRRGWFCFGKCRRGGTIYDLAGPLFGYDLRGKSFVQLRAELRRLFGLEDL